jgi:antitoxin YqcF
MSANQQIEYSAENKMVGKWACKAFKGTPQIQVYHHDTQERDISLVWCVHRPTSRVISYSTVGLSDYPMVHEGKEIPLRLEIVAAAGFRDTLFANALASVAFYIMRTRRYVHPGFVIPAYVKEYITDATVPHLYFTEPYLWPGELTTLDCGTKTVRWLQAVPISDAERRLLAERGDAALEMALQEKQADILNLRRESVA